MTAYPLPNKHPRTDRGARRFDQSQLRTHGTQATAVHRDYAAHWFRWGFALTFIEAGMRSLEIGCGVDQPLIQVLRGTNVGHVPALHVAVDLNKIPRPSGIAWTRTIDEFNFVDDYPELVRQFGSQSFDVITCFEVIEHMEKPDGRRLLNGARALLRPGQKNNAALNGGRFLLSTPVYNGRHMAAAHIHEYRVDELREEVERAGLRVLDRFGTFMTANAMKRVATAEERALVEELHRFYPYEVLANFLAPKYPDAASNNVWVLATRR